jgi:hypothetical protein
MKNLQEEEEKLKLLNQIIEARKSPNSDEIFSDQEKDEEKEHENDEELERLIKELDIEKVEDAREELEILERRRSRLLNRPRELEETDLLIPKLK